MSVRRTDTSSNVDWEAVLERSRPAIVELRINAVRPFDGKGAACFVGTGWVVDKKNGFIVTNRHIVTLGPVTGDAVFTNKKRVPVVAVYRDPVHDFGFFRYNPEDIKDYKELSEITMAPSEAKVGGEFRIIGSGESEQNSVIPGTLANLERDAPRYKGYWDFNTFYFGAVSNAKSGSSGSPIIAQSGHAVALNCGGSAHGAASFFLPLDRVLHALKKLQAKESVYRGTLLCIFVHKTFDEVTERGLASTHEKALRKLFPNATGMLITGEVVPEGPASVAGLKPGDVLLKMDGEYLRGFHRLQQIMDDETKPTVKLLISRSGEEMEFEIEKENMENVTPSEYVTIGNVVVHPMSYVTAVSRNLPVGGVQVASSGYMFTHAGIKGGAVITEIDGKTVLNIDQFEQVLAEYADGSQVIVRFHYEKKITLTAVVTIDRRWYPMARVTRNDKTGLWDDRQCKQPTGKGRMSPSKEIKEVDTSSFESDDPKHCLVHVDFRVPVNIEGNAFSRNFGCGVVVDVKRGLVVVSRAHVFSQLGDVIVSINSLLEVPGEVVFMHPVYSFVIVQYDPAALVGKGVKVCQAQMSPLPPFKLGEKARFIGLSTKQEVLYQDCTLTTKERPTFAQVKPPRYVPRNHEFLVFDQIVSLNGTSGGVFLREDGKVGALWLCFLVGSGMGNNLECNAVLASLVFDCLAYLKEKHPVGSAKGFCTVPFQSLGVALRSTSLGKMREATGLSDKWVMKLQEVDTDHTHQILSIYRIMTDRPANEHLKEGDYILALNDKPVVSFAAFENAVYKHNEIKVTRLRNREVTDVVVRTTALYGSSVDRVLSIGGLTLHETFDAVRFHGFIPKEIDRGGVYVSGITQGSPAMRGKMNRNGWITKVKNKPTPNLDAFLDEIGKLKDKEWVSFELTKLNSATELLTMKNDYHYFGPSQLVLSGEGDWVLEKLS